MSRYFECKNYYFQIKNIKYLIIFTLNIINYLEHGNISEEVALTLFSLDDMFEYYSKNKEYDVSSFVGIEIFIHNYLKNRKESSDE